MTHRGSGAGSQPLVLAAAVEPSGDAPGIDANPALREVAEQRATAVGSRARVPGLRRARPPLPDATVDVVWRERVLRHLAEQDKAGR